MSNSKHTVHSEVIKTVDYEILILGLPTNDLEDLLTHFVPERGKISKSLYEDFLIANCVANLNQFMAHINTATQIGDVDLIELRKEITALILKHNKKLKSENIVINKNQVLKLKTPNDKDSISLSENTYWDKSYYDDNGNYKAPEETNKSCSNKDCANSNRDISELEWNDTKVWWHRLSEYIIIKQYSSENIDNILRQRYFHNSTSFNTYIVSNCIVDVEDIYERIDGMGANVDPNKIIRELFELCEDVNKGLNFTRAKELQDPESIDEEESDSNSSAKRERTRKKFGSKKSTKKKLTFKSVPKKDLLKLNDSIKVSLIGQDEAIDKVTESIKRASVGLKNPIKPIGSFMLAGKTGCGKSLAGKILADELIPTKKNRVIIDCSEYSSDHEYSKLIGCFVPGTKVLKSDGTVSNIEEINVGDKVVSHTGNKRLVEYVHEYDQEGDMVEITTVNTNIPVTTTKTHEVYAIKSSKCQYASKPYDICKPTCKKKECTNKLYKNYKPEWVPASELKVGDIVMYPKVKTTSEYPEKLDLSDYLEGTKRYKWDDEFIWAQEHVKVPRFIEVNEDLARLAGYYVSEGGISSSAKTINFTFHSKEHDYIIEVVKLVRRIFGKDVRIKIQDRVEKGNTYRIYVSSKIVCNFMSSLFGHNTYVKHLPMWFNELPNDIIRGFLETAVFGDGCTVIPRRMDYSTVSPNLFYQMEQLFRKLNFVTYKNLEDRKKLSSKFSDRYRLYIGGSQITRLNDEFNFNIDLSGLEQTNIQRMSYQDENYQYLQIKKINTVYYKGKVYDLAIEKDTSYVTEFIVHNSPNGYIGHDDGGVLTNAITANPFSVVVFDEIEKASTKVYDLLLQILDEGRLTDGKGKAVSFKDTIIIMTSNIGVKEMDDVTKTIGFGDVSLLTEDTKTKALDKALKDKFNPEFLNRIDSIVYFKDLTKEDYMKIIDLELYKLTENLKLNDSGYKDIVLNFDSKTREFIYNNGVDEKFGARPITRAIEKYISTEIAGLLLNNEFSPYVIINTTIEDDKVTLKVDDKEKDQELSLLSNAQ